MTIPSVGESVGMKRTALPESGFAPVHCTAVSHYSTTLGRTPFTPQQNYINVTIVAWSWAAWTITPLWGYPCRSGMSGVHFLVEYIAEYRAIFPRCVYTNRREVRCGTHMLSLGQALKGSVLWLP